VKKILLFKFSSQNFTLTKHIPYTFYSFSSFTTSCYPGNGNAVFTSDGTMTSSEFQVFLPRKKKN